MRHASPRSDMVVKNVRAWGAERIILLPLYPQFSTTTTDSSFQDWAASANAENLTLPTVKINSYPDAFGFIAAHAKLIKDMYWNAAEYQRPRVLFSAHGLPQKLIRLGDPYQEQVEKTVQSIVQILSIEHLDWALCYQSKVGPKTWLKPSLDEEITR